MLGLSDEMSSSQVPLLHKYLKKYTRRSTTSLQWLGHSRNKRYVEIYITFVLESKEGISFNVKEAHPVVAVEGLSNHSKYRFNPRPFLAHLGPILACRLMPLKSIGGGGTPQLSRKLS